MSKLPKIICSSVIRSSQQGNSHGGIYIVDLESGGFEEVIDWNDQSIDWSGRGADRGLRGFDFYNDQIICAASDEVFFFSKNFEIIKSIKNRYLKHCHEIFVLNGMLYLTSSGYDSILVYNLEKNQFEKGFLYRQKSTLGWFQKMLKKLKFTSKINFFELRSFNPEIENDIELKDTSHINMVFAEGDHIYFSGTKMDHMMAIPIGGGDAMPVLNTGLGTHNVRFYGDHIVYNNTALDKVTVVRRDNPSDQFHFDIIKYPKEDLEFSNIGNDHARQGFGRGLCVYGEYIIAGSSPSTISVYSIENRSLIKQINLTLDVRNSIHGLEVYPF